MRDSQEQFLEVIDRDLAEQRFQAALSLAPLAAERVPLAEALHRVAARPVASPVDVPGFDRSNVDGFALRAADTHGAGEERPRALRLMGETITPGTAPAETLAPGQARGIATGGMLPRGADAVVMVEHTRAGDGILEVERPLTAGANVSFAGSDIVAGEIVVARGEPLTSRETGVLAAVGVAEVEVFRRPRVAILSTGNELIPPGGSLAPGQIFDSNARILADAVRELGGEPWPLGIAPDDRTALRARLAEALAGADAVILSGGTSKGGGDLCYRAVADLCRPGILAHGVALKPGKPVCLAAHEGKPVAVLPGFPTSAVFTFHEFLAPVLRRLAGRSPDERPTRPARLATRVNSEIGRTEYLLVGLIESGEELLAYPLGKGSGSVTAFSRADGFVTLGRHEELVERGTRVQVTLLARDLRPADLVVIGSHCVGLDLLLSRLQEEGFHTKFLAVGSTAGLAAAQRGECDLAGAHLLDPATGQYNRPFLAPGMELIPGYRRRQGILFRPDDPRFAGRPLDEALAAALADPECVLVNRNAGSGTRLLVDRLLAGAQPPGYAVQPRNHHAVAAAIAQGRADWGLAIESVARRLGLGFLPYQDEEYDFLLAPGRGGRPAVRRLRALLADEEMRRALAELGCFTGSGRV